MIRRRRRLTGFGKTNPNNLVSVGNKISERDANSLSVYLLNFSKKYSFADEVLDFFFYIIRVKNRQDFLEQIFNFEIEKLYLQKKLHFLETVKKSISEKIKNDGKLKIEKTLNIIFGKEVEENSKADESTESIESADENELFDKKNSATIINYYLKNRKELSDEIYCGFAEDRDCCDRVPFGHPSDYFGLCFARILAILGEEEIRNVMAFSLFYKNTKEEPETLKESFKKFCEKRTKIPARVLNNFYDCSALQIVIDFASLNETEASLLKMFYMQKRFASFSELEDNINRENWMFFYATLLGVQESEIAKALRADKPLMFYGLVKKNRRTELYMLGDDVLTCITAGDMSTFFTSVLREIEVKPYALESFSCNEENTKIVQKLLKGDQNVNILLYGAPGSGKTEFAKSIINSVGKKVLLFKNDLELNEDENVICALNRISAVNQGNDAVIVVDEADKLLGTANKNFSFGPVSGSFPSEQKGPINKMMEESKNQIIWITNYTNQIDESTKRRFTFSIEFNPMSEETLKKITLTKLSDIPFSDKMKNQVSELCTKYKITGASVENIRKMILSIQSANAADSKNESEEEELSEIDRILVSNSSLLHGKAKMREKQCASYDISVLNTSMDADKIVKMISNAKRFSEKHKGTESGIRLLFFGASGTGKTEFTRYIADKLDMKITIMRASDILDSYVGGTEQKIAAAFAQAEQTGNILLFDEADSFFYDRENAMRSWERTSVNEFLTQIEEFSGILICTTNLKKILDPAVNRRFHLSCEFKPLNEQGIEKLLGKFFSSLEFSDSQIRELAESNSLTPGDFGALASRLRFMEEDEYNAENIVDELFTLQKQKKNSDVYESKIGF